jgi:hypothetical protein
MADKRDKGERRLRPRRAKCYQEIDEGDEEEEEGMSMFKYNIIDKLKDPRFLADNGLVQHHTDGQELSVQSLQRSNFSKPLVFHSTNGLNMK